MNWNDKPTSRGSRQRLAMLRSGRRYRDRQAGEVEEIQYGTLADARKALS